MDDLLEEFLSESEDNLAMLSRDILALEKNPVDGALVARIFRTVHTIKGSCGFLPLPRLQKLAQQAEGTLSVCRDGHVAVTPVTIRMMLDLTDRIASIVKGIHAFGREPAGQDDDLIGRMETARSEAPPAMPPEEAPTSIRLQVAALEEIMNMTGELVLARNRLRRRASRDKDIDHLGAIVSNLQRQVTAARLQPVGSAFSRLPRIVRDAAAALGKKIKLDIAGADTALDRHMLGVLQAPLTHIVRNACDHGIETPARRRFANKAEEGVIRIAARQDGGQIIIEVSDDGAGLDKDKVRDKAIQQGLVNSQEAADMDDAALAKLIFTPGFSTAREVTAISGRGVGLDVVKDNLEKAGGQVELSSRPGHGMTMTLRLPLTLAIIPALIATAGGLRYAIAQNMIEEVMRPDRLLDMDGALFLRRGDVTVPVVRLAPDARGRVLVLRHGRGFYGLLVEKISGIEEIYVKPLPKNICRNNIYSGAAVLGDGGLAVVLDTQGLARKSGIKTEIVAAVQAVAPKQKKTRLLVFDGGGLSACAVPLSLVARLAQPAVSDICHAGGKSALMHAEKLIPLVPFSDHVLFRENGRQPVMVFTEGAHAIGVAVNNFGSIVEDVLDVQLTSAGHPWILGTAILNGKVTDIIDISHFLRVDKAAETPFAQNKQKRILLVDDSPFFRNLLTPALQVAGYDVMTVPDAESALDLCRRGEAFDIILSDIEMPGMSGFEFAKHVRAAGSAWRQVPLLALSAHATAYDIRKGRAAGFDDYITKFDRDSLLSSIAKTGAAA